MWRGDCSFALSISGVAGLGQEVADRRCFPAAEQLLANHLPTQAAPAAGQGSHAVMQYGLVLKTDARTNVSPVMQTLILTGECVHFASRSCLYLLTSISL